jgi:hypothetical protein
MKFESSQSPKPEELGTDIKEMPLQPLTPLERQSRLKKLGIRLRKSLKNKIAAYSMSAFAAVISGEVSQGTVEYYAGIDPVKIEEFFEKQKDSVAVQESPTSEKAEGGGAKEWILETMEKVKNSVERPDQLIENSETYKIMLEKYYQILTLIDDAAFLVPALFVFIMLGGYLNRKLAEFEGDSVTQSENERTRREINLLIQRSNALLKEIQKKDPAALTLEEAEAVRRMLKEGRDFLPPANEVI